MVVLFSRNMRSQESVVDSLLGRLSTGGEYPRVHHVEWLLNVIVGIIIIDSGADDHSAR